MTLKHPHDFLPAFLLKCFFDFGGKPQIKIVRRDNLAQKISEPQERQVYFEPHASLSAVPG